MTRVAILGKRRDQALIGQPGTAAHQSVQQDDGPPGTDLPPGQFKAIQATEPVHRQIRHEHKVYHGPEAGGYLAQPHPACLLVVGQRGRHGSLRSGHRKRPVSWAVNYRIAVRAQSLIASKNLRGAGTRRLRVVSPIAGSLPPGCRGLSGYSHQSVPGRARQ